MHSRYRTIPLRYWKAFSYDSSLSASITGGRGVDHVVDVRGPGTLDQSIKALKGGGFIPVVGLLGGTETTIDQLTFIVRNASRIAYGWQS